MRGHRSTAPVLVGVDGSAGSLAAVEFGAWEAKRRRVALQLVTGYIGETPYLTYGMATVGSLTHSLRDEARATVTEVEFQTRSKHPGLSVRATVVAGGGASGLVELSRDASLVVVGSRGHGGFGDLLIGSVAAQVAMHAHAPVVVVRPPVADRSHAADAARVGAAAGPVVVGLDGSAGSELALRFAVDEAVARDRPLVVAHVWWAHANDGNAEAGADRLIADAIDPWVAKHPDLQIERRPIHDRNPTWSLIETSREAALLVVGTRGRGGFASLLLGSVSRALAAHARCPIAVVHEHA